MPESEPRVLTPRLEIRLARRDDVPELVRFHLENREHLERWSPAWPDGFFTAAHWEDQVERRLVEWRTGTAARMFIFPLDRPATIAGNIALSQIARGPMQSCFLGYSLAASEQGKGYMVEAVEATVRFAFEEMGLHRVSAQYMPHNRRSGQVLRRCGFAVEGYGRDYLQIAGRWEDHVFTAILNPASS